MRTTTTTTAIRHLMLPAFFSFPWFPFYSIHPVIPMTFLSFSAKIASQTVHPRPAPRRQRGERTKGGLIRFGGAHE